MRVAIIGYGVEGQAAFRYWQAKGADVTIRDQAVMDRLAPGATVVTGDDYLKDLDKYDLVVRSARVKPWLVHTKAPVTTVAKEFFAQCPARIIGVTGTKGKGTTTSLIARILGESAWRTWVGGDSGQAPLDFLAKVRANHMVVLELSSFQLMDLDISPHIGVCLMITPAHLDWHRNVREYVAAKGNLFWHQRAEDLAVYNAQNDFSTQVAQLSPGQKLPFLEAPGASVIDGRIVIGGSDICGADEVGLIGPHNLQNICAAITATWDLVGQNPEAIRRAVKAFTGLPHRLEHVRDFKGVAYFDDAYSTTPETAIAAIESFDRPKILILGGSDQHASYHRLAERIGSGNVRYVVLIGENAPRIKTELDRVDFEKVIMGARTMPEVMSSVRAVAEPGDVVILSPASASFGLFDDYKDQGKQFQVAVKGLK